MANTFDTSRVGGGTYELEQDSNGNYKLKSVGFNQVNKLNLPDVKDLNLPKTTATKDTTTTTTTADPFLKLGNQQQGGGEGGAQDYSAVAPKEAKVKEATVSELGQKTNTTYNAMTDAEKNAIATGTSGMVFDGAGVDKKESIAEENYNKALSDAKIAKGGSPSIFANAKNNLSDARKQVDQAYGFGDDITTPYQDAITRGQVGVKAGSITPERVTGLQKVKAKATGLKADISNMASKSFALNAIKGGAKVLGAVLGGVGEAIFGPETPTQKLNKSYFNVRGGSVDGQRIAGNPATDLYAGFNRNSDFGNLEKAGNKRLETRQKTIERKGYKAGDKFFDDTEKMKEQAKDYK